MKNARILLECETPMGGLKISTKKGPGSGLGLSRKKIGNQRGNITLFKEKFLGIQKSGKNERKTLKNSPFWAFFKKSEKNYSLPKWAKSTIKNRILFEKNGVFV